MNTVGHKTVLLQEVVDTLDIAPDDVVVDATFGGGGHSLAIAKLLGKGGVLVGLDEDSSALKRGEDLFKEMECSTKLVHSNFRNLDTALEGLEIKEADKYIFDLGFSSIQLEEGGRGLSFIRDEPLFMTLSVDRDEATLTAHRIVNEWSKEHIEAVIKGYGEESFAPRIAEAIVEARAEGEIKTTKQLAGIIFQAVPAWYRYGGKRGKKIHPATKTFQALRIAVNDEIESLEIGLQKAYEHLSLDGRIAVISFHSIEDRVVKRTFRTWKDEGKGKLIVKSPIVPTREEVLENPRSRSAKLRVFQKHVTSNIT